MIYSKKKSREVWRKATGWKPKGAYHHTGTAIHTGSSPDRIKVSRGSKGKKCITRDAHKYCPIDEETGLHVCGCKSKRKCGGRWWANRYPMSMVAKNEITARIAQCKKSLAITERRMTGVK